MLKQIDARGLLCPQPVILAKKEWNDNRQAFSILVDNLIAVQNLQKLAQSLRLEINIKSSSELIAGQESEESYEILFLGLEQGVDGENVSRETLINDLQQPAMSSTINSTVISTSDVAPSIGRTNTPTTATRLQNSLKPFTLFVGKDYIGEGDQELGQQLITMYFYTLTQSEAVPRTIAFMNRGVFLPTMNDQVIEHLHTLEEKGCKILVCGACLNFYQLKDRLKVGEISNMYAIWNNLSEFNSIVSL